MFDNTYNYSVGGPTSVTVTEKRAPTDDSVRLLTEMENAVREKIIRTLPLESNVVKGQVWTMRDPLMWKNKFAVVVDINGHRKQIDVETDPSDDVDNQLRTIYENIAREIAVAIMPTVFNTMKDIVP